jgi:hypothetical protein
MFRTYFGVGIKIQSNQPTSKQESRTVTMCFLVR